MATTGRDRDRESARVWAFLHKVEVEYFPVYELDEYDQILAGIPFIREAWSYDRFHELDLPVGELLLFAVCAQPYESGHDSRLALLDAAGAHVPDALLAEIPETGLTPAELHERLDDTPYSAAAAYADWLWGDTGSLFLDVDDEMVVDIEWTRENVLELTDHWRLASDLLDRTSKLTRWLEMDPAAHFEQLLAAALGHDAHLEYERMRRCYACEITEHGVLPIPHHETEDVEPLPVSLGAAA